MNFIDCFCDESPIGTIRKVRNFGDKKWKLIIDVITNEEKLIGEKNILSKDKSEVIGSEKFVISYYPSDKFFGKKEYYTVGYEKKLKENLEEDIYIINNFKNRFNFKIMNLFCNRIKQSAPQEKDYSSCPDWED